MTRILLILLVFSPLHAQEGPTAADVERVERLSSDAAVHYRAGRFRDAITLYQDAWQIVPSAGVLYNIARCHEALGLWMEAADRFDKVVVDGHAPPELRARAAERSRQARQQAVQKASAPPPPEATPEPAFTPPTAAASDPPEDGALRTSAWFLGGAGLAAFVTGGILVGMGNGDLADLESAKHGGQGDLTRVEALDLRDQGESRRLVGTVTMVIGGAALLGAVLTLTHERTPERGRVAPAPAGLSFSF